MSASSPYAPFRADEWMRHSLIRPRKAFPAAASDHGFCNVETSCQVIRFCSLFVMLSRESCSSSPL